MTPDDTRQLLARLLGRIAPEIDLDELDPDEPLSEEADLDSMDFLNLVAALHEETGVEIPEADYDDVASVNGFVSYVAARA